MPIAALVARIRTILQPLVRCGSARAGSEAGRGRCCTSPKSIAGTPVPRSTVHSLTYRARRPAGAGRTSRRAAIDRAARAGNRGRVSTGVTRRGGSATPLSPPPPGPLPPAPLPVPLPTPPAPVPGPRTSDAPWVGAAPCRGVSVATIGWHLRRHDPRLGRHDRRRLALDVLGRRSALLVLGLGGRALLAEAAGAAGGFAQVEDAAARSADRSGRTSPTGAGRANSSAAWIAITAAMRRLCRAS